MTAKAKPHLRTVDQVIDELLATPREREWTASGSHLIDPDGSEQIDQPGAEKLLAKIAAALNAYDKLPRPK